MFKKVLLTSALFLSSCASVNSISLTSIPAERSHKVSTIKEKTIFMGFNFDNDFIDYMVEDLKRQCPNGKVTGILTKDVDVDYFLYIIWKKQVTATGYCVNGGVASNKQKRGSASEDASDAGADQL